jgi:hypothetical protein
MGVKPVIHIQLASRFFMILLSDLQRKSTRWLLARRYFFLAVKKPA